MKAFEYANPATEAQAVELLGTKWGETEVLAGGTDLLALMKDFVVTPRRVVNIKNIPSLHTLRRDAQGLVLGATTTIDELLVSDSLSGYDAVRQAAEGMPSMQVRALATVGGDLCQRPRCWYFRAGNGLLAMRDGRSLVADGDNRHHAILGNSGAALFVSPSVLAPALIALEAEVRIIGPGPDDEQRVPLEYFYLAPKQEGQRETVLLPNQIVTHVVVPPAEGLQSATYQVRQLAGDWPLVSAAAALRIEGGVVRDARIVMGQVAPTPWTSYEAARELVGRPVSQATAQAAGDAAVATADALSRNAHKIQMARAAVKRAVLRAVGLLEGGL
jgi:xanthine dehydrogenase YagS FAD-binding subunit